MQDVGKTYLDFFDFSTISPNKKSKNSFLPESLNMATESEVPWNLLYVHDD